MTGLEVERKFLLAGAAGGPRRAPVQRLEQGYLAIDPAGAEVRMRRKDDETLMTVKIGIGLVRGEEEFAIDRERFERLWPLTEGRQVVKTRFLVPLEGGLTAEVDVYDGALAGLLTGEVEFPDEADRARVRRAGLARARRHRRPALREPEARGRRHPLNAGRRGAYHRAGLPQPKEPVHAPRIDRRHPGRRPRRHLIRIRSRPRPPRSRPVPDRSARSWSARTAARCTCSRTTRRPRAPATTPARRPGRRCSPRGSRRRPGRRSRRCLGPRSARTASGRSPTRATRSTTTPPTGRPATRPARRSVACGSSCRGRGARSSADSAHLLRRAHQHLVDRHVARPRDDVGDRVGDVLGRQPLVGARSASAASRISGRRWCVTSSVATRARLHQRHAHVALGDLLAQRLAERADAVLGQLVHAAAGAHAAAGDGADVDEVGDAPRVGLRRAAAGAAARRARRRAGPAR